MDLVPGDEEKAVGVFFDESDCLQDFDVVIDVLVMALQLLRQGVDAQSARFMERIEKLKPLRCQVLEEGSDFLKSSIFQSLCLHLEERQAQVFAAGLAVKLHSPE